MPMSDNDKVPLTNHKKSTVISAIIPAFGGFLYILNQFYQLPNEYSNLVLFLIGSILFFLVLLASLYGIFRIISYLISKKGNRKKNTSGFSENPIKYIMNTLEEEETLDL